jgi:hypothetical protein
VLPKEEYLCTVFSTKSSRVGNIEEGFMHKVTIELDLEN